jgi:hypothetical protein
MVAREVEHAATELRVLRREAQQQGGLAAVAFGLALTASQLRPAFAVPLLFGGIASLFLLVRALSRRWELIDRLVLDRDAYAIPEVRRRAEEAATMESRHALASTIRNLLNQPALVPAGRVSTSATDLEVLAAELDDDHLALDPVSAVACTRLLGDMAESPLRNPRFPPEDVHSRIAQILGGFRPRDSGPSSDRRGGAPREREHERPRLDRTPRIAGTADGRR